jgi:hypothetical protein
MLAAFQERLRLTPGDVATFLPAAGAWAERLARDAAISGTPLNAEERRIAKDVGVEHASLVRVVSVDVLPAPEEPLLRAAAAAAGFLDPGMVGLTLGHAIFVCRGRKTRRLLSHELRHVHQYEQHGSIAAFLSVYLRQVLEVGYANAPLEMDARAHEIDEQAGMNRR